MTPELKARIDADMAEVVGMDLPRMLGFLAGYTARFTDEISRGEATRDQIRGYADGALESLRRLTPGHAQDPRG